MEKNMKQSAEIWNNAARNLEFQRNFEGAALCYKRAKKFEDDSVETLLNLAVSYLQLCNFYKQDKYLIQAKEFLLSAIEKDEKNSRLHYYLGVVYTELKESELAAQEFFYTEKREMEENELMFYFNIQTEIPVLHETEGPPIYELLPDPTLYKIFDLVKGFPIDSRLLKELKETYGNKDSASLLALYLRSIYFKVFEDKELSYEVGLLTKQLKWEALLVFFICGINKKSKAFVRSIIKNGKIDTEKLPTYTRLLIERYRRELVSFSYDKKSFKALTSGLLKKLEYLDSACELVKKQKEHGRGDIKKVLEILKKAGFVHRKKGRIVFSKELASESDEDERIERKIAEQEYDEELVILFYVLLKQKRFEHALKLAKKINALYDEEEAIAYIKELISLFKFSEDEKFAILSI